MLLWYYWRVTDSNIFKKSFKHIIFLAILLTLGIGFFLTPYGTGVFSSFYGYFFAFACPLFFPPYFLSLSREKKLNYLFLKTFLLSSGTIFSVSFLYIVYLLYICDHAPTVDSFGCSAEPFPLASLAAFFGIWNLFLNFISTTIYTFLSGVNNSRLKPFHKPHSGQR